MTDASQSKVHLCQSIGRSFLLLPIHIDTANIALFSFHQVCALNKHTSRTTARVVKCTIKWFYNCCNELDNIVRCIELSFFLCCINSKLFQKVFIYTTYQVFFFPKGLVAYLIYLIHNLLYVISTKIALSECAFYKTTFQSRIGFANASQCSIESHIQLWCCSIDDG